MPDLGKYADTVLSSYAVSIALIVILVVMSILRAGKVKKQLETIERKVKSNA